MNNYSLSYMVKVAAKYWLVLVLAACVTATSAYSYYNFIVEPKYSATGSIVVTNGMIVTEQGYNNATTNQVTDKDKVENSDVVASLNFADTVTDVLKTSEIYKQLAKETGGKYSFDNLMGRTTVKRRSETTLFVDITFVDSNPKQALKILNKYLSLAPDYINSVVENASSSVIYADKASWAYPSDIMLIGVGGIFGAALAYVIVFFIYSTSNVIRSEENFREHCKLNVIGVVPDFAAVKAHEKRYNNYYGYGGKKNGK